MSGDEVVVLIGSGILAVVCWGAWYIVPVRIARPAGRAAVDALLYLTPPAAMALLYVVLRTAAAHDVRNDPTYLALYLVLGAAWVGLWIRWLPLTGVSARDDVVERGNISAAAAVSGATAGLMLCYAGGNIGDGPGWWVVVFSAALATAALFVCAMLLELVGGVSEAVTVDRDLASGVRLGAFFVAEGLIFGRSVAGDWITTEATVRDFADMAWPGLIVVIVAAVIESWCRPTPDNPRPAVVVYGFVPGVLYLAAAIYQVLRLGSPA